MAKSKIEYNENYTHSCENEKKELVVYKKNISDITVSGEDSTCGNSTLCTPETFRKIFDFYVSKAPVLKNDKKDTEGFGLRSLKDLGWIGNTGLGRLEAELISKADLTLYFIRSESIGSTLEAMNLDGSICIEHPRGVLQQKTNVILKENGEVSITPGERRMECLFRHIRNSLAHGRTYYFNNGFIMLEDIDDNSKKTARLLLKFQSLIDWIEIIEHPDNYLIKQPKKPKKQS